VFIYLFYSENVNKIFYDILRAHEAFEGVKTGVFAILSLSNSDLYLIKMLILYSSPMRLFLILTLKKKCLTS